MLSNARRVILSNTSRIPQLLLAVTLCKASVVRTFGDAWIVSFLNACCDARPESPVMFNHVEADGSWYCLLHRNPPCCVCRVTLRPESAMLSRMKFKDWTCDPCKHLQTRVQTVHVVSNSSQSVPTVTKGVPNSYAASQTGISKQRGWHTCNECRQRPRTKDFNLKDCRPDSGRCKDCRI